MQKSKHKNQEREFFDEYSKANSEGTYYMFTADIKAGDNLIRTKGFNTEKKPTHARDLAEIVDVGMKVKVEGSLSESCDPETGKIYREVLVWNITPVDETEQPRTAVILQGFIHDVDYTLSKGLDLVINIPNLLGEEKLFRVKGDSSNQYVQWLLKQKHSIGDSIKVNCFWLNSVIRDDFDEIVEVNNYLDLVKITNYHCASALAQFNTGLPF